MVILIPTLLVYQTRRLHINRFTKQSIERSRQSPMALS